MNSQGYASPGELMLRLEKSWPQIRTDRTGWLSVKQAQGWSRTWIVLKGSLLLLFEDATVCCALRVALACLSCHHVATGLAGQRSEGPAHTLGQAQHTYHCRRLPGCVSRPVLACPSKHAGNTPSDTPLLQEVRPLEVMNVASAPLTEINLQQDPSRASTALHSKGLIVQVQPETWL